MSSWQLVIKIAGNYSGDVHVLTPVLLWMNHIAPNSVALMVEIANTCMKLDFVWSPESYISAYTGCSLVNFMN